MREKMLEVVAEPGFHVIPHGRDGRRRGGTGAPEAISLEDVVAGKRLAALVQHQEHAVRAIDARGRDENDVAVREQEARKARARLGFERCEFAVEHVAHREDAFFAQGRIGAQLDRRPPSAHARREEGFVAAAQ